MSEDLGGGGGSWGDEGDGGGVYSETSYESWFQRIGKAIFGVFIGLVLIIGSFVLLFWNEGRAVNRARDLDATGGAVVTVASEKIDPTNEAKPVHTTGNLATDDAPTDTLFGVRAKGVIQLTRKVEMYQWKEEVKEQTQKQVGGGTKTTKNYNYEKRWVDHAIDSSGFKQSNHKNPSWPGDVSSNAFNAAKVTLGAFTLPSSLIAKIGGPEPRTVTDEDAKNLPDAAKKTYRIEGGAFFKGKGTIADPQIGDLKVTFSVVKPREVSIIAEQTQNTFRAYMPRAGGNPIEELRDGNKSAKEMIAQAEAENDLMTWILRAVGFVLMAIGIYLIFNPFVVFADVLPFLGSFASVVLGIVALLASCLLSLVTIAIGWVAYRPLVAIPVLVVAGLGVVVVVGGLVKLGRRNSKPAVWSANEEIKVKQTGGARHRPGRVQVASGADSESQCRRTHFLSCNGVGRPPRKGIRVCRGARWIG